MATTLRSAVFAKLKDSRITNLLSTGDDSVLLAGRVTTDTPTPCVALEMGAEFGRDRALPFVQATFTIFVYHKAQSSSSADYSKIDEVLNTVRTVLDGASLTLSDVGRVAFDCAWIFKSKDHFDERRRAAYRYHRYKVWMVKLSHYH